MTISIPIIHYESGRYVVLNKPCELTFDETVKNAQGDFVPTAQELTGHGRQRYNAPHAVHRLDRLTSGCLLVGCTSSQRRRFSKAFAKRRVTKEYIAVTLGRPKSDTGAINLPLLETTITAPSGRLVSGVIISEEGKPATTQYEVLGANEEYAVLRLHPKTGRMHQLRAHCASMDTPILGDPWYNPHNSAPDPDAPMFLHASQLCIPGHHDTTLRFSAPLPIYMINKIKEIGVNFG